MCLSYILYLTKERDVYNMNGKKKFHIQEKDNDKSDKQNQKENISDKNIPIKYCSKIVDFF